MFECSCLVVLQHLLTIVSPTTLRVLRNCSLAHCFLEFRFGNDGNVTGMQSHLWEHLTQGVAPGGKELGSSRLLWSEEVCKGPGSHLQDTVFLLGAEPRRRTFCDSLLLVSLAKARLWARGVFSVVFGLYLGGHRLHKSHDTSNQFAILGGFSGVETLQPVRANFQ